MNEYKQLFESGVGAIYVPSGQFEEICKVSGLVEWIKNPGHIERSENKTV